MQPHCVHALAGEPGEESLGIRADLGIAERIFDVVGLGALALTVWGVAKWPAMLLLFVLVLAVLYQLTPNVRPTRFRLLSVIDEAAPDRADLRWTLDTLDDYRLLHALATRLGPAIETASTDEIAALVEAEPALRALNAHVQQKPH